MLDATFKRCKMNFASFYIILQIITVEESRKSAFLSHLHLFQNIYVFFITNGCSRIFVLQNASFFRRNAIIFIFFSEGMLFLFFRGTYAQRKARVAYSVEVPRRLVFQNECDFYFFRMNVIYIFSEGM